MGIMGRKVKWFDTVQKILSTSEPADHHPVETESKVTIYSIPLKMDLLHSFPSFRQAPLVSCFTDVLVQKNAAKSKDKSKSFKKLWQLAKSSDNASTSATAGAHHQQQKRPPPSPSQPQGQEMVGEAQSQDACREQGDSICPTEAKAAVAPEDRAESAACAFKGGHCRHRDPGGLQRLSGIASSHFAFFNFILTLSDPFYL
jgi:hypothetical protein